MSYDMRNFLKPRRLTIAMWDQAYMVRRNPGDPFRDWERCLEELKERGYNTIRIDAFPGVIDVKNPDYEFTWPDSSNTPFMPWCWFREYTGKPGKDLVEFINLANKKGLFLSLSSWWGDEKSLRVLPEDTMQAAELWTGLLDFLERETGLENIVFVDLCNEIPGFLPGYEKKLGELGKLSLAPVETGKWNINQKGFLKTTLDSSLKAVQQAFPKYRFTYSMNMNKQFEDVNLENLDVLDIHFFLTDSRWVNRTKFDEVTKNAFETDKNYREFSKRCREAVEAAGPMMRQLQRQQLKWASEFSQKIGAPLVTSEAWASWFYTDHPDLDWDWLNSWCENAVDDAIEYNLWGITTFNYAEPHFSNWKDVKWHLKLNERFLNS